ncbi:PREDICTED: ribosomal protein S6 kinase delta-1 [Dufourea novaeangliae]|uniref:ribosomal protein S6 kinase delta-1 n=1 Tax=Dufourea novaeangliae TaxID=178035 RepID=UPI000766F4EB|nr:PREDICTED: ribosomal protein S6 kinase delta-1 [Dufourea novaeangliae]
MAPTRDKWVRRFIIPETTRHKKGFTIYKITSVVFLKSSHEEISKVSVWKRYNDFKKLHSELNILFSRSQIKESYPSFPKPKFFGRFEAEVIEERRECALKFLEFIGRHSYLYSSDIFIKFFETSHVDFSLNDCSQSLSSDTSAEDDRHMYINSPPTADVVSHSIFEPKVVHNSISPISTSENETNQSQEACKSKELQFAQLNNSNSKTENKKASMTKSAADNLLVQDNNLDKIISSLEDNPLICNKNNNYYEDSNHNIQNDKDCMFVQTSSGNVNTNAIAANVNSSVITHDGSDLPQTWSDSSQYILVAAAHMNAAFKHEDLTEYEEAFTQYKMGISSLRSGVEMDSNKIRAEIIKDKISKYLERAEKLYNRYLNCNISLLNKPISELQYYKVLKIMESVMLVKDIRRNCLNIVKTVKKSPTNKENISNYILRGQVPYMVQLNACIETETTTFLILQHLGRGKLWNFIMSHYNSNNNISCDRTIVENSIEKSVNNINIILKKESIQNGGSASVDNLNFTSTNSKVQMEIDPMAVKKKYEICRDVSTTRLLEKAQILLQSVNATLKESNTVANRLRESDHFINHESDTKLLNIKNNINQSKNWTEVSVDINEISLEIGGISENTTIEKLPEKNVIVSNYLTVNNNKKVKSQCSTDNSSLSDSFRDLSFDEKESSSSSDNLKGADTYLTIDRAGSIKADNLINSFETKIFTKSYDKTKRSDNHTSVDQQLQYITTTQLMESIKNDTTDLEQDLWTIPENVVRLWAAEILLALEALHQQEVIVFDLKPDNILLDDSGHVRLTYVVPTRDIDLLKYKYPYASPELCMFSPMIPLTSASDIWSFGVILYELIVGNKFQDKHPSVFQSHSILNIPSKLSENAKSLLLNIVKYQPHERLTILEIKQHPFFKEINWSSLANTL